MDILSSDEDMNLYTDQETTTRRNSLLAHKKNTTSQTNKKLQFAEARELNE